MITWKTNSPNTSLAFVRIITQNSLLRMIESLKTKLYNGSKVGVIIMELSKAFDSLNHYLLLAKLEAYGLDNNAVTNRLQRCKINQ